METSSSEAKLDLYTDSTGYEGGEPVLAGNITVSGTVGQAHGTGGVEFNTLDEPISQTIRRDLAAVGTKFLAVLWPKEKKSLLKEWDLWGPLILCTFMATILQSHIEDDDHVHGLKGSGGDGGPEFAEVFVIVWVGALVVTLNTKLLGGHISFFQSVCVLGYCLLPLGIALAICRIILMASNQSMGLFILR